MIGKIGIAIITVDREDFFNQCVETIPDSDELVIIHNGDEYKKFNQLKNTNIQSWSTTSNVAVNKNRALRTLIGAGCEHLFLCEDDIRFTRKDLCEYYIKTAERSGIWHLNYGAHGFYNRDDNNIPKVRATMEYGEDVKVDFYQNILGAWSYYHKNIIDKVGYMDQRYNNAMEHVDHTYEIIKKRFHPPFWWFADAYQSYNYIYDIKDNFEGSKIRHDNLKWQKNMSNAFSLYLHKHGHTPTETPQSTQQQVDESLQALEQYCSKK